MKNDKWFYFDEDEFMYKLTDDAPEKAKKSYEEFYDAVFEEEGRSDERL